MKCCVLKFLLILILISFSQTTKSLKKKSIIETTKFISFDCSIYGEALDIIDNDTLKCYAKNYLRGGGSTINIKVNFKKPMRKLYVSL